MSPKHGTFAFPTASTLADLRQDPDRLFKQTDLVPVLDKSKYWFERARWAGQGPPYIKIGNSVRYRAGDVLAWLDAQTKSFAGNTEEG